MKLRPMVAFVLGPKSWARTMLRNSSPRHSTRKKRPTPSSLRSRDVSILQQSRKVKQRRKYPFAKRQGRPNEYPIFDIRGRRHCSRPHFFVAWQNLAKGGIRNTRLTLGVSFILRGGRCASRFLNRMEDHGQNCQ